ncbi:hypothetical protein IW261DRAFT_1536852 [Armillaria novae-zelandiae]|uniref:F-box domain-containing protein n=1 Tax=Armillaria novae-zelandiae TaxID=153914 RepID=A0AA39N741_9AGAR|nr:hypothetical protein IW261DRAFT_1536852 [Armillaria novae-zelandiae]
MDTPFSWSPCVGCACPNHNLPSRDLPPNRHSLNDPNLAHLACSNDKPSDIEMATLHAMISSYEADIHNIDVGETRLAQFIADMKDRISRAEKKVDALRQERQSISDAITERKRILNPVRRLPAEVLLRIFRLTTTFPIPRSHSENEEEEGWDFHPPKNMLWIIEGVCKPWNMVVTSFPELWSSINIVITDDNFDNTARGIAYSRLLGTQLDRSRNQLLSVCILNDHDHSSIIKLPTAIAIILFSFSTRIQNLHLYLPAQIISDIASLHITLPSLNELCIFPTDLGAMEKYQGLDLFRCPNLRSIHVVDVVAPLFHFQLPWTQITTFTSDSALYSEHPSGPSPQTCLLVMQRLTQLTECHLRLELGTPEGDWTGEALPVVCSDLRVLALSSWGFDTHTPLKELLDDLVTPALMQLQVVCCQNYTQRDSEETFTAICDLLERSGPPHITTLHFTHGCVLREDLLQVLKTCSTLEDIRLTDIDDSAVSDETLLQLTLRVDGTTPLVPRLHTLHISGVMSFNVQIFVDMVESRWTLAHAQSPPVRRLHEVNLCRFLDTENSDRPDEDEVERITVLSALDVYRAQGLDVTLDTKVQ